MATSKLWILAGTWHDRRTDARDDLLTPRAEFFQRGNRLYDVDECGRPEFEQPVMVEADGALVFAEMRFRPADDLTTRDMMAAISI